ncbi:hypothetical protein BGZ99_004326 [Dissophora globulifera]|uniref:Photolyase/cryptochrome alpha/beta domain-containing protein n=1 Tax=Dissophora globulifera TaxID=979702 RepID=A0A9P6RXJ2_9FUNG|nr:hypothetical protein BGZ99_004326 [Dissophora globulifera]
MASHRKRSDHDLHNDPPEPIGKSSNNNNSTSMSSRGSRSKIQRTNNVISPLMDHADTANVKEEIDDSAHPTGTTSTRNTLMWFRNDLRLQDNKALYEASMRSKVGAKYLIALYIVSEEEWKEHDEAPVKIDFWMRNLVSLKAKLDKIAIPLVVKTAKRKTDVVGVVESVVREFDISHVFWSQELMVDEKRRDKAVKNALQKIKVHVEECEDQYIVNPLNVRTKTGNPYAVFTPFYNTWCKLVETEPHHLRLTEAPDANPHEAKDLFARYFKATIPSSHPHGLDVETINNLYPAGEDEAHLRLNAFLKTKVKNYRVSRNIPIPEGTSVMSPYLNAGVISTRQCVVMARAANKNKITTGDEDIKSWIKELGWREFYRNILVSFPRVCMNRAFQLKTEKLQWSNNDEHFQRWCEGKTGFPIVDAGMRQLNSIGYMHNRLRMVTACFLAKDLLIDWHKGERYFMQRLIDGDLASNNGGWQWSASTGTDAQPYFRVFNPLLQSQRFDPKGDYIRRWVPELQGLTDKQIHDPYHILDAKEFAKLGYPKPVVDHAKARDKFVNEFKRVLALA